MKPPRLAALERSLDGLVIRNANRGDSRESIRRRQKEDKNCFHNVRAIRANRNRRTCDSQFLVPQNAVRTNGRLCKACRSAGVMKMSPEPCVEVPTQNAMKFLVKFCCSSFLRKRSLKVPSIFHEKNSRRRRLSLTKGFSSGTIRRCARICEIDSRELGHPRYHSFRNHYIFSAKTIDNHVTVIAENSRECNCVLLEKQGNCNCNANYLGRPHECCNCNPLNNSKIVVSCVNWT